MYSCQVLDKNLTNINFCYKLPIFCHSIEASNRSFYLIFNKKTRSLRDIADNTQTQKRFVSWVTVGAFSAKSPT